jgi:CBS domain-containing protein
VLRVAPITELRKAARMQAHVGQENFEQANLASNIGAVCTREVVVAEGNESVFELARIMRRHHVGAVVIVDHKGEQCFPLGIVTDRDIVVDALVTSFDNIREMKASELVKQSVVTIHEDQDIDEVIASMRKHGVRRVPVVDNQGALVGILTVDDLVEIFAYRLSQLASLYAQQQREERRDRP